MMLQITSESISACSGKLLSKRQTSKVVTVLWDESTSQRHDVIWMSRQHGIFKPLGPCLNITTAFQVWTFHYTDKTVVGPYYLYNGLLFYWKVGIFILRWHQDTNKTTHGWRFALIFIQRITTIMPWLWKISIFHINIFIFSWHW